MNVDKGVVGQGHSPLRRKLPYLNKPTPTESSKLYANAATSFDDSSSTKYRTKRSPYISRNSCDNQSISDFSNTGDGVSGKIDPKLLRDFMRDCAENYYSRNDSTTSTCRDNSDNNNNPLKININQTENINRTAADILPLSSSTVRFDPTILHFESGRQDLDENHHHLLTNMKLESSDVTLATKSNQNSKSHQNHHKHGQQRSTSLRERGVVRAKSFKDDNNYDDDDDSNKNAIVKIPESSNSQHSFHGEQEGIVDMFEYFKNYARPGKSEEEEKEKTFNGNLERNNIRSSNSNSPSYYSEKGHDNKLTKKFSDPSINHYHQGQPDFPTNEKLNYNKSHHKRYSLANLTGDVSYQFNGANRTTDNYSGGRPKTWDLAIDANDPKHVHYAGIINSPVEYDDWRHHTTSQDHENLEPPPVITPPPIVRVRNFSLTPEGNVINRGDSFRLRKPSLSNMPAASTGLMRPSHTFTRKRAESLTPLNVRRSIYSSSAYSQQNNSLKDSPAGSGGVVSMKFGTNGNGQQWHHRRSISSHEQPILINKNDHIPYYGKKYDRYDVDIDGVSAEGDLELDDDRAKLLRNSRSNLMDVPQQQHQHHFNGVENNEGEVYDPYYPDDQSLPSGEDEREEGFEECNHYRVLLVGADNVGKSSILAQFMSSEYINPYDYSDLDDEVFGSSATEITSTTNENVNNSPTLVSNTINNNNNDLATHGLGAAHQSHPKFQLLEDINENKILEIDQSGDVEKRRQSPPAAQPYGLESSQSLFIKEKSISLTLDNESSLLTFNEMTIKDTEGFDDFYQNYCTEEGESEPDGYVIVYSVNDRRTFENAIDVLYTLKSKLTLPKARILVGNKCDLVRAKEITTDEAINIAKTYGCKFIETSVGLNVNLDNLLVGILTQIRVKNALADAIRKEIENGEWVGGLSPITRDCYSRMSDVMVEDLIGNGDANGLKCLTKSDGKRRRLKLKKRLKKVLVGDKKGSPGGGEDVDKGQNHHMIVEPSYRAHEIICNANPKNSMTLHSFPFKDLPAGIETDSSSTDFFRKRRSLIGASKGTATKMLNKFVKAAKRHSSALPDLTKSYENIHINNNYK